jgi:hypothetical protein
MFRETGMRLHIRCRQKDEKRHRPTEYNWFNPQGWTHIYDVGLEELKRVKRMFDKVELISYGKYYGDKERKDVDEMCKKLGVMK